MMAILFEFLGIIGLALWIAVSLRILVNRIRYGEAGVRAMREKKQHEEGTPQ